MECTKPRVTQPKQPWQKIFLPLCCLLAPIAEGPLAPTFLGVDAILSAFLLLYCCSGGRFRFGNNSLICSLIYALPKQSTAVVHEICALTGYFLHFPDSWLVFMGSQRATDTRNLIKAVRMLMVSVFLILRKQSSQ